MTIADKIVFTPEELEKLPDAVNFELVNGNLVERHMGAESSVIAAVINYILQSFVRGKQIGFVAGADCGYQCFADDPQKLRKPDVSFVRSGRVPNDRPPKGYIRVAPDLAVEVISPGDLASEVDEKIEDYVSAGVRLVWIVNPERKTVHIFRPPGTQQRRTDWLGDGDIISGEDVLPGFESPVAEFFKI